jgi:hypothetical protein
LVGICGSETDFFAVGQSIVVGVTVTWVGVVGGFCIITKTVTIGVPYEWVGRAWQGRFFDAVGQVVAVGVWVLGVGLGIDTGSVNRAVGLAVIARGASARVSGAVAQSVAVAVCRKGIGGVAVVSIRGPGACSAGVGEAADA